MQVFLYGWNISASGGMTGEVRRAVLKDLVDYQELGFSTVVQEAVKTFEEGSGGRVVK